MFKIMCVTNRHLCQGDFLGQVEKVAQIAAIEEQSVGFVSQNILSGIILREKDLSEAEYKELARKVMEICQAYHVSCILHNFVDAAMELGASTIHLPMSVLRQLGAGQKQIFTALGASCHSVEEAKEAQELGCTYITAGHIFTTDCKKDVPPRGLDFLREVCNVVTIPVYAIGGIDSGNIRLVRQAGAAGACIMSGLMRCHEPRDFMKGLGCANPQNSLEAADGNSSYRNYIIDAIGNLLPEQLDGGESMKCDKKDNSKGGVGYEVR